ncbi:hypothetical protein [Azospirillum palustre]
MNPVQPLFVDTDQARLMLGDIGKTKLFELLKNRQLKRVKIGSKTLVEVASIHAFADTLKAA